MTGKQPSERALEAAERVSFALRGPCGALMTWERVAAIIDEHFRGHDELVAALEGMIASSTVRSFEAGRAALAAAKDTGGPT